MKISLRINFIFGILALLSRGGHAFNWLKLPLAPDISQESTTTSSTTTTTTTTSNTTVTTPAEQLTSTVGPSDVDNINDRVDTTTSTSTTASTTTSTMTTPRETTTTSTTITTTTTTTTESATYYVVDVEVINDVNETSESATVATTGTAATTTLDNSTKAFDIDMINDNEVDMNETTVTVAAITESLESSVTTIASVDIGNIDDQVNNETVASESVTSNVTVDITEAPETSNATEGPEGRKIVLDGNCDSGYWDTDRERIESGNCLFLCHCRGGVDCADDGSCPGDSAEKACPYGYKGRQCMEPICTEGCGEFGKCTGYNKCTCYGHYVKDEMVFEHENGTDVVGHRCASVRVKGLKGFVAAMAILIVSISFCGLVQHSNEKRYDHGKAYSYINNN